MEQNELILNSKSENGLIVSFNTSFVSNFHQNKTNQVALLISKEYEEISINDGISSYYADLSQKLHQNGWYVILLVCSSQDKFGGKSNIESLQHIFSICEIEQVLVLQPIHSAILDHVKYDEVDYTSYCCLFFTQAVVNAFQGSLIYVEFPEQSGVGYRTIQAKQSRILPSNCITAVTLHSSHEWLFEANKRYVENNSSLFWQIYYYEQYSFENADLAFFSSYYLKSRVESYGWKTDHAMYLPSFIPTPIVDKVISTSRKNLQIPTQLSFVQITEELFTQKIQYIKYVLEKSKLKFNYEPKVTVGVTCYNLGNYLLECLNSLKIQTYKNLEVIVIDDASTDEYTQEVFNQAESIFLNFKFIRVNSNLGLGAARNYLIELAQGEYFIPFDVDNVALPFMVERYVKAAIESNAAIVSSPLLGFGIPMVGMESGAWVHSFSGGLLPTMLNKNCWGDAGSLFDLRILRQFKHPEARDIVTHDWQIMVAAAVNNEKIVYYAYPLYLYRLRPNSMMRSNQNHARDQYHLRQYLLQIEPQNYSQRQIYFLLTAAQQLLQSEEQLQEVRAELEKTKSQMQEVYTEIERIKFQMQEVDAEAKRAKSLVTAMETSKFWKLRKLWFKVKKKIGLSIDD
jgi:glycosyltransferase involved in cell wall biosynthesis